MSTTTGLVQMSYRQVRGETYGPYMSFRYRENGKQRSYYIGSSLSEQILALEIMHEKLEADRERHYMDSLLTKARQQLRESKTKWNKNSPKSDSL
ncbi:DUF1678 family protein [Bythopirellula polymerisocia]|uniref:Uncharacterized protein n=1 Tax=Bythopirellula polymerisocia TaxID=2528003 RepID=A0A5C6CW69_9BACT|nr:DUF1678 family protein [Bythopirellula polymerisocia]TWU28105.1 hypothetical protein Pla144_13920 [Bythopirellula polymerisocia]